MSNNNKTPAIRFKGFTDTWEQRKLEEVITVGNGMDYKHLSEGDIPVYGTGGYMLNVDKALSYDKDAIGIGRKGTIDKPYVLKAPFWTVDTLFYCIPKEDYSLDFVYCIFQNVNWKEKDESTGVPSLSKVNINSTDVKVPTLAEQEKIGDYFRNLDNLITLHQRKCDKLIQFKAAMLKKMFPQNGADKPELRFKGFTDAWEQRKLGELMEITSVKRIHQSDWTDSGVRFLRARDIVAVSKNEEVSEPLFISQEKYDEYSALSGKVKIGDLLVTGVGTIGVPMLINNEEPLYFKDGNIIWFKNEDRIDGEFFYHSFNGSFIQNFIKESAGIGTVGTYTIESGKKTPILLPTQKDEQQKIGTFFSQLDTLITLHQRKCDKYKSIKAGLIRKFFP
ncbi:restriction endonuclease subunit S [Ruminococcus sp.]|uniref:restriction endonuclease subunit S n=1 Tax=Ruminococcus sp. TaxID=41978 RepID=UPI003AB56A35